MPSPDITFGSGGGSVTSTSTSTVSENTGSNDSLAIGSSTSYIAGDGSQAISFGGSNLSGSVGAEITNNISTGDPAVTAALTSSVEGFQNYAYETTQGLERSLQESLLLSLGNKGSDVPQDSSIPGPGGPKISPKVLLVVVGAIILILAVRS